jgi:hypothetical protein
VNYPWNNSRVRRGGQLMLLTLVWLGSAGRVRAAEVAQVPVTRDAWVSAVGEEAEGNNGGADKLKLKGVQEFALVDGDFSALRGRAVARAWLHLKRQGEESLGRITVSSVSSPWREGTGRNYAAQKGSVCFRWARQGEQAWAYPGSDLTAVINGQGNSLWGFADAEGPDAEGWYRVPVAPEVVAARIAGLSEGFAVFDDVGSEYTRNGEQFTWRLFPNRYVSSREAGAKNAPYFTVALAEGGPAAAPAAVAGLSAGTRLARGEPLPDGDALARWRAPQGAMGFDVTVRVGDAERPAPRYLIPLAGAAGGEVSLRLRDLGLKPGATGEVSVCAVDARGQRGARARTPFQTAANDPAWLALPANPLPPLPAGGEPPQVGGARVFAIDALDKYDAGNDSLIPASDAAYRSVNHLWSARTRTVRLPAARNECVAFQLVLAGNARGLQIHVESPPGLRCRVYRARPVPSRRGPLPDPLLAWAPAGEIGEAGPAVFYVECYVPHDAPGGAQAGAVVIQAPGAPALRLTLDLRVWNFTLPDALSFIPQMNCYSLPEPPAERAYYRLAHEHRTCLNRLGYNWRGQVSAGHAPQLAGGRVDWSQWDARFGPLFDGSAFAGLPRAGVPVDAFYLPLNENWPEPIEPAFKGGYWIETAFGPDYWTGFRRGVEGFGRHLAEKPWGATCFEFYLNNKVYFKRERGGWSGSSAPWIFDEPVNTQDFWALRRYGCEFQRAAAPWRPAANLAFRMDISYPQWQRDLLDGVGDVFVSGGSIRQYHRSLRARRERFGGMLYMYGSANDIEDPNTQPVAWSLDAWSLGCDGVVPWQTLGNDKSWTQADPLALFYPGSPAGVTGPVPSLRLKAFRQGQQTVEYCALWRAGTGRPRWAVEDAVRGLLRFEGQVRKTSAEDAGTLDYRQTDAARLWDLRARLGCALDVLRPEPKRKWVELTPAPRDVSALRDPTVPR